MLVIVRVSNIGYARVCVCVCMYVCQYTVEVHCFLDFTVLEIWLIKCEKSIDFSLDWNRLLWQWRAEGMGIIVATNVKQQKKKNVSMYSTVLFRVRMGRGRRKENEERKTERETECIIWHNHWSVNYCISACVCARVCVYAYVGVYIYIHCLIMAVHWCSTLIAGIDCCNMRYPLWILSICYTVSVGFGWSAWC